MGHQRRKRAFTVHFVVTIEVPVERGVEQRLERFEARQVTTPGRQRTEVVADRSFDEIGDRAHVATGHEGGVEAREFDRSVAGDQDTVRLQGSVHAVRCVVAAELRRGLDQRSHDPPSDPQRLFG